MGAFELMREPHVHVKHRDGVLHAAAAFGHTDRMTNGLYAYLVDGDLAFIRAALNVRDHYLIACIHLLVSCGRILAKLAIYPARSKAPDTLKTFDNSSMCFVANRPESLPQQGELCASRQNAG